MVVLRYLHICQTRVLGLGVDFTFAKNNKKDQEKDNSSNNNNSSNKNKNNNQTWKKLQAVQVALADILSEITLFWGHFESNILYFRVRMEKEELISKQIDLF